MRATKFAGYEGIQAIGQDRVPILRAQGIREQVVPSSGRESPEARSSVDEHAGKVARGFTRDRKEYEEKPDFLSDNFYVELLNNAYRYFTVTNSKAITMRLFEI